MEVLNDNFESDLEELSDEALKYIGVTNLEFHTRLSKEDLNEIQKIIFSINTLIQVTFKDGTTVDDIENIKHLLELSPMCNDKKIEKMILRQNTFEEVKDILAMPYENPDTWHIAYSIIDGTYMLTTLPNYRVMEEYISIVLSCVKENMTPLEKIKEVYDFVKLLDFDENGSERLPDIIKDRRTNNFGFSLLFSEILKRIDIKTFIGQVKRDNSIENITMIDVKDEKYGADGIYVFDPASDSIPKHVYKSDAIRKVNYNFFGITLMELSNTKEHDKLLPPLLFLNLDSFEYANRKIEKRDRLHLEKVFESRYEEIFDRIKNTKAISDEKLLELFINTIHEEDFLGLHRNIKELLTDNYQLRKKNIFCEALDEDNSLPIHDI